MPGPSSTGPRRGRHGRRRRRQRHHHQQQHVHRRLQQHQRIAGHHRQRLAADHRVGERQDGRSASRCCPAGCWRPASANPTRPRSRSPPFRAAMSVPPARPCRRPHGRARSPRRSGRQILARTRHPLSHTSTVQTANTPALRASGWFLKSSNSIGKPGRSARGGAQCRVASRICSCMQPLEPRRMPSPFRRHWWLQPCAIGTVGLPASTGAARPRGKPRAWCRESLVKTVDAVRQARCLPARVGRFRPVACTSPKRGRKRSGTRERQSEPPSETPCKAPGLPTAERLRCPPTGSGAGTSIRSCCASARLWPGAVGACAPRPGRGRAPQRRRWRFTSSFSSRPFCALTSALFGRVAHHVIVTAAIAPLLVAALPSSAAAGRLRALQLPGSLAIWTAAQTVVFWAWHAPPLYALALSHDAVYALMQLSLLGVAVGFWSAIRRSSAPAAAAALLATMVQMGLLGALLTFVPRAALRAAPGQHHGLGPHPARGPAAGRADHVGARRRASTCWRRYCCSAAGWRGEGAATVAAAMIETAARLGAQAYRPSRYSPVGVASSTGSWPRSCCSSSAGAIYTSWLYPGGDKLHAYESP